jgi:phthiodiolone/phenolphthiodiolone dimycocerosates ketoreductase
LRWESPARRLRESIEVIRLLWSGRKVDYNGRIWRLKDAILSLTPEREGRYPPIWVGAHSNMTLETTGRLADGWLPEHLDVNEYSEKLKRVMDAARNAGRDPECITPALMTSLVISEDHEDCHRMLNSVAAKAYALLAPFQKYEAYGYKHPLGNLNAYKEYIPTRVSEAEVLSAIEKVPHEICEHRYIHGTPEEVVEKIEDYVRIGLQHIILWNLTPLCDYSKTKESFSALLKVVQHFKDMRKK